MDAEHFSQSQIMDADMNHYLCTLESGRDFVIKAPSHYDAAYIADDESKLMDDYLVDVIPTDY